MVRDLKRSQSKRSFDLHGEIQQQLKNLHSLEILTIEYAGLTGVIPQEIGDLRHLEVLGLDINSLQGPIPATIFNISTLRILGFTENHLLSKLPSSIRLPNLKEWYLDGNNLDGIIPHSISNLSKLIHLDLALNNFSHSLPNSLGNLELLELLNLEGNNFIGESSNAELSLITALTKCRRLRKLWIAENPLNGILPVSIGNLSTSLQEIDARNCEIKGSIPNHIGNLSNLAFLSLYGNGFTGSIPMTVKQLQRLQVLDLGYNKIQGPIPNNLCHLHNLGDIPDTVGALQTLISLSLAHNRLCGHIPESFGNLISLESLDVSYNNLSGVISKSMESLLYLQYFNASFNRLQGEIPTKGPFINFTNQSFMSNEALCGAPQLQIPPCHSSSLHGSRTKRVLLVGYILFPIALIAMTFTFVSIRCWKRNRTPTETELLPTLTQDRISYKELLHATNGFSNSNLLGTGSFGSIYRGTFIDGTVLAIKVFNIKLEGASKSFDTECEMLRNTRHRNLTKVISSCSNLDFRALRLDIMIDVACALDYLHHGYSIPLVHCDLKPNNVLLDEDMVAHLSDFGISKFLGEGESIDHTKTLATLGYIVPGEAFDINFFQILLQEGLISTRSDIYSYGMMLMETFTRTKPSDEKFAGDLSLKLWVSESLPNAIIHVIDANLLSPEEGQLGAKVQCVSAILQLALNCCAESQDQHERNPGNTEEDQT
ncbi:receptor kinase-like protein Xa21 [Cornus florida]|uniref:receptor kinase-like protein Xa21 n=1 Tax=Cornus florida TaxID=4283 RepID=UPI00289BEF82|nr:receptor kinase-like protein Xa21 [Cornus florida]